MQMGAGCTVLAERSENPAFVLPLSAGRRQAVGPVKIISVFALIVTEH
jgi:hypothetical protein